MALKGGEVRVYRDKVLLDTLQLAGGPSAEPVSLRFGKFGREDNSLVILHKSGALSVKVRQEMRDGSVCGSVCVSGGCRGVAVCVAGCVVRKRSRLYETSDGRACVHSPSPSTLCVLFV